MKLDLFNPLSDFSIKKKEESTNGKYLPLYTKINLFKKDETTKVRRKVKKDIEDFCKKHNAEVSEEWLFSKENLQFYLDFEDFILNNRAIFCCVIGSPGYGKSNLIKVFINEISKLCYDTEEGRKKASAVIIDPVGELALAKTFAKKVIVDIRYEEKATCYEEEMLQKKRENKTKSNIVVSIFPNALEDIKKKKGKKEKNNFLFKVLDICRVDENLIKSLKQEGFFGEKELTDENVSAFVFKLIYHTLLNHQFLFFTFFLNNEMLDFIASKIVQETLIVAKSLHEAEKALGRSPLQHVFLIIDELPSFAPLGKTPEHSLTTRNVSTYCMTGRKYGCHVVITSQRFAFLPRSLRDMLNIRIFFGGQNTDDVKVLEDSYPVADTVNLPRGRVTFLSLVNKYLKKGCCRVFSVYGDGEVKDWGVFVVQKAFNDEDILEH